VNESLTSLIRADAVPMETLQRRYGALLQLVEKLIGVMPNCDPYLEIWPPAFRTYNVMVPNFLNLPFTLWGAGAPGDVLGLAMYVASRTAGCAYCSAHTSSFALRRGARPAKVASALDEGRDELNDAERAAVAVARALSRVPASDPTAERAELLRHFPPKQAEWIVASIAMMGFLNKFMDAMGVELESATMAEVVGVIGPSGWDPGKHADGAPPATPPPSADGLGTKLGVIPLIPTALSLDRRWTSGVPTSWPDVGRYLREHTGADFSVLSRLTQARVIRAVGVMLRDNLDPGTSTIGLPTKHLAGLVYATVVGDEPLAAEVRRLAEHGRVPAGDQEAAVAFARGAALPAGGDAARRAALILARGASPSPAEIDAEVLAVCREARLPAAAIVELVAWISVLQMIHRLNLFYPPA
jgi:alkylhydroperoxidase family enzyme